MTGLSPRTKKQQKSRNNEPVLVRNALLITPKTASGGILLQEKTSILIEDGRFSRISRSGEVIRSPKHGIVIDAEGSVVMPGLFNAHTHSYEMLYKGSWDGHTLQDRLPFDRDNMLHKTKDNYACTISSQASYADYLLGGTTFVGDVLCGHDLDLTRFSSRMKECGLKGVLYTYDIRHYLRDLENDMDSGIIFGLSLPEEVENFKNLKDENSRKEHFIEARDALNRKPGQVHMHVQETDKRNRLSRRKFGCTTIEFLEKTGLLGRRTTLSHGVKVGSADIQRMMRSGANLVSCPTAEMKLCDGIAPLPAYIEAGVDVCLGTDGPLCNNSNDIIREAKTCCLIHAINSRNPAIIRPEDAFRMITLDAARCFGVDDRLGSIEVGKDADLVMLDSKNFRMTPRIKVPYDNRVSNIIYCATGQDVKHVIISGRMVVENGKLLTMDEARVRERLQRHAENLLSGFETRFYPKREMQ